MSKKILHVNDKIKAYFIDLDGTLLDDKDHTGKIPSYMNVEGCRYAISIDKHIIISTGREFAKARAHAKRVGAKYIISSNGAAIHDVDGKLLSEHFLTDGSYRNTIKVAADNKLLTIVRGDKNVYGATGIIQRFAIKRIYGMRPVRNYSTQTLFATHKIILIGPKDKLMKARDEILASDAKVNVVFQNKFLEITHEKASKGLAAEWLAKKKLKIPPSTCAHIGDTGNDASAADHLGVAIAMGNSTDDYLSVATHIGPSYKVGGVARVIAGDYKANVVPKVIVEPKATVEEKQKKEKKAKKEKKQKKVTKIK